MEHLPNIFALMTTPSIAIVLFIWLFYHYIKRRSQIPALKLLGRLIPVFLVREGLASVFFIIRSYIPIPFSVLDIVFFITNALSILFLILWSAKYTGRKGMVIPFILVNVLVAGFLAANIILDLLITVPTIQRLISWVVLLGDWIALVIVLGSVTGFNTTNASHIIDTRTRLTQITIAYGIIGVILLGILNTFNYETAFIKNIFLPLFYAPFVYIFYKYITLHETEEEQRIQVLDKDINSLFDFMSNLGSAISEKFDPSQVLNFITSSVVKSTNADAGAIMLVDEVENTLKVEAVTGVFPPPYPVPDMVKVKIASMQNYFKSMPIKIGETILGEVAKTGKPIFIRDTLKDDRMKQNTQNDTLFVSSIIVLPLIVSKRIMGVIALLRRDRTKVFTETDYDHVKTFANYSSLTLDFLFTYLELIEKREMERELGIAAEIQQKLLPRKLPELKTASIGAFSIPAKGVSGDYYDILQFSGNRIGLVICDVAGKGVPAALIMVMIRSILHLITSAEKNAANVITWINRGITGKIDIDRFATMSFLTYDENTGEVIYSNAAHHPLLIFRAKTATLESIDTEGLPIGIERAAKYAQKRFKLYKGDVAVLYTDGIIEAMNQTGEQFTYERFAKLIQDNAALTTDEIIAKLKADLKAFVGPAPQHDDQTLMLMKVN
jgi:sigma-B regulation protein RsbU (phosphoserine phosphatase)